MAKLKFNIPSSLPDAMDGEKSKVLINIWGTHKEAENRTIYPGKFVKVGNNTILYHQNRKSIGNQKERKNGLFNMFSSRATLLTLYRFMLSPMCRQYGFNIY